MIQLKRQTNEKSYFAPSELLQSEKKTGGNFQQSKVLQPELESEVKKTKPEKAFCGVIDKKAGDEKRCDTFIANFELCHSSCAHEAT